MQGTHKGHKSSSLWALVSHPQQTTNGATTDGQRKPPVEKIDRYIPRVALSRFRYAANARPRFLEASCDDATSPSFLKNLDARLIRHFEVLPFHVLSLRTTHLIWEWARVLIKRGWDAIANTDRRKNDRYGRSESHEDGQLANSWPSWVQRGHFGETAVLSRRLTPRGHGVWHIAQEQGNKCALRGLSAGPRGSGGSVGARP